MLVLQQFSGIKLIDNDEKIRQNPTICFAGTGFTLLHSSLHTGIIGWQALVAMGLSPLTY
jgi:hypothetical protein